MAVAVTKLNTPLYVRKGNALLNIQPETSGEQVKLAARNGVTAATAQAELEAVHARMDGLLSNADAMRFKGVVNADADLPAADYEAGWTYKVGAAGVYKGRDCEEGDLIIVNASRADSGSVDGDFDVVQANIKGAVTGPDAAADGNLAAFDQATGKVIRDSGLSAAELGKVWVKTAASLPDTLPEDLKEGGLLVVDAGVVA